MQQDFLPTIVDVSGRGPNPKKQIPYSQYKNTLKYLKNRDKMLNMTMVETTKQNSSIIAENAESVYGSTHKSILRGRQ